MYFILQFGTIWAIYDREATECRLLEPEEINSLQRQFTNLLGKGALSTLQITKINPSKLMKLPEAGYIIVRVGETWTLYEGGKSTSRVMDPLQVGDLKRLCPRIVDSQMLAAVSVDAINPAKLVNLPFASNGLTSHLSKADGDGFSSPGTKKAA